MKILIPNPLPEQIKEIESLLAQDRNCNFGQLEYFLKQIILNRDVSFHITADKELVIPARKAWEIIVLWSRGEGNLPVGDRDPKFNIRSGATSLLQFIKTNISGKSAEAAASYRLILEQARFPNSPASIPSVPGQDSNLQKIFALRRKQIEQLEAKFFQPLTSKLTNSKVLTNIKDATTRTLVLQMLAADSADFRLVPSDRDNIITAEKIHQLLLHQPGIKDVNAVMRLIYSKNAQSDFQALSAIINTTIQETYKNNEKEYLKDMGALRNLSSMSPTLDSISYLVKSLNISSSETETAALIKAIKSQIIAAATTEHIDGKRLIGTALKSIGFSEISVDYFQPLIPFVEEIQVKQRHLLLGNDLYDKDTRLLATSGLAAELGVDLTTPWIKERELNQIIERAISPVAVDLFQTNPERLKTGKTLTLQEAFDYEYSKGNNADPQKLIEFTKLISLERDFGLYHKSVDANLGFRFQELISKGVGNYLAIKQPIDRFTDKVWGGIEHIDDIIRGPQRRLAEWWDKTQELHPWLNPIGLITGKFVSYQTGIALRINTWAIKISGVSSTSNALMKSLAGHIADYTEGFIHHEASWGGAGAFFVQRKIGNALDWAAKFSTKGKYGTFTGLRFAVANKVWSGLTKLAPGLSAKMAANGLKNVIIGVIGGEMTMGVSIAVQVGWEALKYGVGFIKKFLTDGKFAEKVINKIPIAMMMGSIVSGMIALPGILVGGLLALGSATLTIIGGALSLLTTTIFIPAILFIGIGIGSLFILVKLKDFTVNIDSGIASLVASAICEDSKVSVTNATANVALCIAEIANKCPGLNPITESKLGGSSWKCFVAGLAFKNAIAEIEKSAHVPNNEGGEGNLQCVGLSAASAADGDGAFHAQRHACTYASINLPPGYKYFDGCTGMQPGDHFIMGVDNCLGTGGTTVGHIGVIIERDGGAGFSCVDANFSNPGEIRGPSSCHFATSQISGCIRKI